MRQTLKSIFWKILSCACYACINVIVRYLTGGSPLGIAHTLPIFVIMFFQNIVGALTFVPWLYWQKKPLKVGRNLVLNFTRVSLATISIGLWYMSLRYMPITEVIGLGFVSPIITIIAAMLFLHEKLTVNKSVAILCTIIGSFFMLRPDKSIGLLGIYGWYALLPILAATFFALDKILVRKLLSLGENPELLAVYLLLFIVPACLLPLISNSWVWPQGTHIYWLVILGMLSALANFSFNKAYELAEVTFLMPFGFAKILISGLLSYLAFAEFPRSLDIWLGIGIIGISAIILSRRKALIA